MELKLKLVIVACILMLGSLSVQAETRTPDILSSVSFSSVQALTKSESEDVRGEYRYCRFGAGCTNWFVSSTYPNQIAGFRLDVYQVFGYYVSR